MNRIYKILFFIVLLFSFENIMAQTIPTGMMFQAVARDASGNAAVSRTIYALVDVHQKSATGESVYSETHQVISNDDGIFTLIIGGEKGVRISGDVSFSNLNWRSEIYFMNLKIAIAPSLPTPGWDLAKEYVDMGTSQIWAVPYAFSAYKAVIADSATKISGILSGESGGTGISNPGKTITLGRSMELKGFGNLIVNTTGPTNVTFPTIGTLISSESFDTLSNKFLFSPTFLGNPKTPTADSSSNDGSVASTAFVKSTVASQIGSVLKISDTLAMLSNRIERDTASLSKRINLKVNSLNAKIDSSLAVKGITTLTDSLYVKGKVQIDSILRINDSLRVKGNVLIDSNLTVKGRLTLSTALEFQDSLVIQKGARVIKGLIVEDTLFARKSVSIDENLKVKGKVQFDSTLNVINKATLNDSLRVKGSVLIDSNLTVKGRLTLSTALEFQDSLVIQKGARVIKGLIVGDTLFARRSVSIDENVYARGKVQLDSSLAVKGITTLNDSLNVKGKVQLDSILRINDSLRVKGNVKIDSNVYVRGSFRLGGDLILDSGLFRQNFVVNLGEGIKFGRYGYKDTIVAKGKTIDQVFYDILTDITHPVYTLPTLKILDLPKIDINTTSKTLEYEIGSNLGRINLSSKFIQNDAGRVLSIIYKKNGVNITDSSDIISSLDSTLFYTSTYFFDSGLTKMNRIGYFDTTGKVLAGSILSDSITIKPLPKSYWGYSDSANIVDAQLKGTDTTINNSGFARSQAKSSFNISLSGGEKYIYYAYPASYPNLYSVMVGPFESIDAFTKVTRSVVNAQGYVQLYNIYVSINNFSDKVEKIEIK